MINIQKEDLLKNLSEQAKWYFRGPWPIMQAEPIAMAELVKAGLATQHSSPFKFCQNLKSWDDFYWCLTELGISLHPIYSLKK